MLRILVSLAMITGAMGILCEEARIKCSYREGCATALEAYLLGCSTVLQQGLLDECPEMCQNTLIALTSTDEGKELMTCTCDSDQCQENRERIEVCRPYVMMAARSDSILTCDTAHWICQADATCAKALEYYNSYCQTMFIGKRCSFRCKNSIYILKKQEKAAKLDSCRCGGREEFDCPRIRRNMDKLCFNKTDTLPPIVDIDNNDISIETNYGEKTADFDNNITAKPSAASFVSRLSFLLLPFLLIINKYLSTYFFLS